MDFPLILKLNSAPQLNYVIDCSLLRTWKHVKKNLQYMLVATVLTATKSYYIQVMPSIDMVSSQGWKKN